VIRSQPLLQCSPVIQHSSKMEIDDDLVTVLFVAGGYPNAKDMQSLRFSACECYIMEKQEYAILPSLPNPIIMTSSCFVPGVGWVILGGESKEAGKFYDTVHLLDIEGGSKEWDVQTIPRLPKKIWLYPSVGLWEEDEKKLLCIAGIFFVRSVLGFLFGAC